MASLHACWVLQHAALPHLPGMHPLLLHLVCPPPPAPPTPHPQIYVAFELGSFFQNFRRYVRSYDPTRMHDAPPTASPISACQPFSYLDGNESLPISPCGQIAANFFNDTFRLLAPGGAELDLDDSAIAWPSDADHLYGPVAAENYNPASSPALRGGNTSDLVLNANQHWMVRAWRGGGRAGGRCVGGASGRAAGWQQEGSRRRRPACLLCRGLAGAGVDAAPQPGGDTEAVRPAEHCHRGGHRADAGGEQPVQHVRVWGAQDG